jgi:hypothetical protein
MHRTVRGILLACPDSPVANRGKGVCLIRSPRKSMYRQTYGVLCCPFLALPLGPRPEGAVRLGQQESTTIGSRKKTKEA